MTDSRLLTSKARAALDGGAETSLRLLRELPDFIWHRQAAAISDRLELELSDAMAGACDGTNHLLIVGPTGNGKTMLGKRFATRHQAPDDPALSCRVMPVLYTRMASGSPVLYLRLLLGDLGAKHSLSSSFDQLYPLAIALLRRIGVRVLIIDELHHIIFGKRDEQQRMLNLIKDLGEQLNCIIVGCGLKEALYAMRWDAQLDRRFEPLPLKRWTLDEDYCDLLEAIENTLPLAEPSGLFTAELAPWIAAQSEGTIKETQRLIRRAAAVAITSGKTRIDLKLLKELRWVKPSQRRNQVERSLSDDPMPTVA